MIEDVRRVVMGERGSGEPVVSHLEVVQPMKLGAGRVWHIWGWDETPVLPDDAGEPYQPWSWSPPIGGLRVTATRFSLEQAARSEEERRDEAALKELADAEPCGRVDDPDRPGMHRTDSIDIGIVVSGEVTVECGDGAQVVLQPGDVYVQNGAMHRWQPEAASQAHVVFVSLGVERSS